MKKTLTLTLVAILATIASYSQTTQEEYNYITKGFKVQQESGLDMKAGYSFKKLSDSKINATDGLRATEFWGLYRSSDLLHPCAIMVQYQKQGSGAMYFCIPHPNSSPEMWQQAFALINTSFSLSGVVPYQAIMYGLMQFSAKEAVK